MTSQGNQEQIRSAEGISGNADASGGTENPTTFVEAVAAVQTDIPTEDQIAAIEAAMDTAGMVQVNGERIPFSIAVNNASLVEDMKRKALEGFRAHEGEAQVPGQPATETELQPEVAEDVAASPERAASPEQHLSELLAGAQTLEELAEAIAVLADEDGRFAGNSGVLMHIPSAMGYIKNAKQDPSALRYVYDTRIRDRASELLANELSSLMQEPQAPEQPGDAAPASPPIEAIPTAEPEPAIPVEEGSVERESGQEQALRSAIQGAQTGAALVLALENIQKNTGNVPTLRDEEYQTYRRIDVAALAGVVTRMSHAMQMGAAAVAERIKKEYLADEEPGPEIAEALERLYPKPDMPSEAPPAAVATPESPEAPPPVAEGVGRTPTETSERRSTKETIVGEMEEAADLKVELQHMSADESVAVSKPAENETDAPDTNSPSESTSLDHTSREGRVAIAEARRRALEVAASFDDLAALVRANENPYEPGAYSTYNGAGIEKRRVPMNTLLDELKRIEVDGVEATEKSWTGQVFRVIRHIEEVDSDLAKAARRIALANHTQT